ncbi:hypothetical protein [Streptomyces fuscigenes]|uniref:hypothetical protein n=1 Tax=Streptomyces fuscigenes TaxID=1528880 RepID=UPI001F2008B7|nr:hypothetical protein [Streptomyces fuscigenes]MCF3960459.1 hypothetical protein [Streptomyces fuscigenes]
MTKDPVGDGQERRSVREQLVARTCAWCGKPVPYKGTGRPPKYCTAAHRTRAYELRTAQARAGRPPGEGGQVQEPVVRVVERTETIVRTVVRREPGEVREVPAARLSGEPYTLPEDAVEWAQALAHLRRTAEAGGLPDVAREPLARACEAAARALRSPRP